MAEWGLNAASLLGFCLLFPVAVRTDTRVFLMRDETFFFFPPCIVLQTSAVSSTLADLRMALQDLSGELRQERQGSQELTQQFAKAKASWELERNELKSLMAQVNMDMGGYTCVFRLGHTQVQFSCVYPSASWLASGTTRALHGASDRRCCLVCQIDPIFIRRPSCQTTWMKKQKTNTNDPRG